MGYIINKNVEKCGLSSDEIDDIIAACSERAPYIRFGKKQKKKPVEDFISVETTKDLWKSKKTEVRANLIRIDDFWYGELYGEWLDFGERWICVTSPYRTKVFAAIALYYGLVKNKLRKTPTDNNNEDDYYDDDLWSVYEEDGFSFPIEIFLAMSEEQAERESHGICLRPAMSNHSPEVYLRLRDIDDELCISKEIDWQTTICLKRENLPAVIDFLYDGEKIDCDYKSVAERIEGDKVWIIGYGD